MRKPKPWPFTVRAVSYDGTAETITVYGHVQEPIGANTRQRSVYARMDLDEATRVRDSLSRQIEKLRERLREGIDL